MLVKVTEGPYNPDLSKLYFEKGFVELTDRAYEKFKGELKPDSRTDTYVQFSLPPESTIYLGQGANMSYFGRAEILYPDGKVQILDESTDYTIYKRGDKKGSRLAITFIIE